MFFKINKCIFIGVRIKAFTMQSKNKIGARVHMRPPLSSSAELSMKKSFITSGPGMKNLCSV